MVSQRQMVDVPLSIPDAPGFDAEDLWNALAAGMSAWLVKGIEAVLEQEVEAFVGAGWHERCPESRRAYRSGYRERRFMVLGFEVQLRVPRVRQAGFRSELLGFRKRRSDEVDRAFVNAYVAGASMREVTALFHQMWGTSVCPSTVSTLVKALDRERREFQSRSLSDDYLYLVLDAMYVRCQVAPSSRLRGVKGGKSVERVAVLLVRGIRRDGSRELVDFRVAPAERETAWTQFLQSLYNRGLTGEKTALFIHDGSDGLESALDTVFTPGGRQRCICHKLGNVWDAVADKDAHRAIRREAAEIYDVETAPEAHERLASFAAAWREREPAAVATLEAGFEQTLEFLAVPKDHRRWVTTTNPIERLIRELRRRLRPMGTFQGLASCRRLIYATIKKLSDERRNAIPYSLWTSQPWYGRGRRRKRPRRCRLERLQKAFEKGFFVS
jgi:transposase-like protein